MQRILLAICLVFLPFVAGAGGDSVSQESIFWPTNGVGDGVATGYTSDQWAWAMRMMWLNDTTLEGVGKGYLNELEVTNPAGVTLRVATGGGIVYGYPYRNTSDVDFTLTTPVINTTGWRLVLRADWAAQTVRPVLLESADGVAVAPGLTQTAGMRWEVSLATGTITVVPAVAITDARTYLEPSIEIDNGHIVNRTRRLFIAAHTGYNITDGTEIFRISLTGLVFPDAKTCAAYSFFTTPSDYVAGTPMTLTAVLWPFATGNLRGTNTSDFGACNEFYGAHSLSTGDLTTAVTIQTNACVNPLVLTNVALGDLITVGFARSGADVLDTIGNSVTFVGWYVDYTADS